MSLHGQWPHLLQDKNSKSSGWLPTAHLKPVAEALLTETQDQAVSTNWLACHILGTATSDLCRKCGLFPESIEHIVAGCSVMAQTVYLNRLNAITSAVHWSLCGACGFKQSEDWWKHNPVPVLENVNYKILYDSNIFTDRLISTRRPDLVVNKETSSTSPGKLFQITHQAKSS